MTPRDTVASGLRVCVLDEVSVAAEGRPAVTIGSLQQKTFLTLLVAAKGKSVSLDAVADELWPEARPRRWRGCLATLANSLRRPHGDPEFIFSTARGYTLHRHPELVRTDPEELRDCLEQARAAEERGLGDVAEKMARQALDVYGTGPWTSDYWGWNEAAAEAARVLATALLRRGAYVACITELSRVMDDFDWHDGLWTCLISAHHKLGNDRRAAALVRRAKSAIGAITPPLAKVEQQLGARPSPQPAYPLGAVERADGVRPCEDVDEEVDSADAVVLALHRRGDVADEGEWDFGSPVSTGLPASRW